MVPLVLGLAAALASPQDPAGAAREGCVLESVEQKEGSFEAAFTCPWPRGSVLRLEITRRTTCMSWAPWLEKDANGLVVERVNLSVRERQDAVHREVIQTSKDGGFSYAWRPRVPGVYHLQVIYDPGAQSARDPRFDREARSAHRVAALAPGQVRGMLVDDSRECLRFAEEFFRALRAAIENSANDVELEAAMRKHVLEAMKRGPRSPHPGTYSVMEMLSPYVATVPKDPEKSGPEDPQKMVPNKIDVKTANLPPSVVRESLFLAILLMQETLEDALLLAPLPETRYAGNRRTAVERIAVELPGAIDDLRKFEPAARLARLWRVTDLDKLMAEGSETVRRMLEKRVADEASVKLLQERLRSAARTIGHPRESLKE